MMFTGSSLVVNRIEPLYSAMSFKEVLPTLNVTFLYEQSSFAKDSVRLQVAIVSFPFSSEGIIVLKTFCRKEIFFSLGEVRDLGISFHVRVSRHTRKKKKKEHNG